MEIHLQGIGKQRAKRVDQLVVGDFIMYNYGYAYEVVQLNPKSAKSTEVVVKGATGICYPRTRRNSTLVGIAKFAVHQG